MGQKYVFVSSKAKVRLRTLLELDKFTGLVSIFSCTGNIMKTRKRRPKSLMIRMKRFEYIAQYEYIICCFHKHVFDIEAVKTQTDE
jgi:hypothetical protein